MTLQVGNILDGTVVNITNFGAFIDISGKTGLVHISEISDTYVKDIRNHLKENEKVKVKVIGIDGDGKISLSIRQASPSKKTVRPVEFDRDHDRKKVQSLSFEERLAKFLKDSEERAQDLKKNQDNKRSGGYSRR
jgi:S1 RNA binding domain protein